jgi:hypothetical protein
MSKFTIKAIHEDDETGAETDVWITFTHFGPSGDGWNEPREDAWCEFHSSDVLSEWAEEWVLEHQAECLEVVQDAYDEAMERRAEDRRDRLRGN